MNTIDTQNQIKEDEGTRYQVYRDSRGFLTGGIGHKITAADCLKDGDPCSKELVEKWWAEDWNETILNYNSLGLKLDDVRRSVLLQMIYNLGLTELLKWHNFLSALRHGHYLEAAFQMGVNGVETGASRWRTEIPDRAHRLMAAMSTGIWVR